MSKLSLLLGILFLLISPSKAIGQNLESDSYRIRMGNFNMTSGTKTSTNYSLTDTVGQTAAEYFSGTGYFVQAGFQYLYTLYDFSFSVSSLLADLGTATSGTFASVNHTLIVSAPGQGYSVTALAVTPLTNTQGSTIPDTTCDNTSCTETAAEVWVNTAVFGFGYNVLPPLPQSQRSRTTRYRYDQYPSRPRSDSHGYLPTQRFSHSSCRQLLHPNYLHRHPCILIFI
ncbi:MAG: hypothetical protein UX40_C0003G0084 [Microgenomates group bacterium GW2011_GWF2_46_18]|nr:MAG: hypothetical protein UX40_C0003G0084 [Microgenomates group bacterium GW2011_GWF2_46_18]